MSGKEEELLFLGLQSSKEIDIVFVGVIELISKELGDFFFENCGFVGEGVVNEIQLKFVEVVLEIKVLFIRK